MWSVYPNNAYLEICTDILGPAADVVTTLNENKCQGVLDTLQNMTNHIYFVFQESHAVY